MKTLIFTEANGAKRVLKVTNKFSDTFETKIKGKKVELETLPTLEHDFKATLGKVEIIADEVITQLKDALKQAKIAFKQQPPVNQPVIRIQCMTGISLNRLVA